MSDPLCPPQRTRLLLLEDSEDDAVLLSIALQSAGVDVELQRVVTEPEFREALANYAPHIVISDSNLPGFSGRQALQLLRATAPHTPFVFLTGDMDPRTQSQAEADAADGYLGKDRMQDVPAVVTRLLSA